MTETNTPKVAIVDYHMGNLFSVKHACEKVGLHADITSSKKEIYSADAVILPGVGAFGAAVEALEQLDLVEVLKEIAESMKPFMGICLGMQLLMDESYEFGHHKGLGIIKGSVIYFDHPKDASGKRLKVPHVGWSRVKKNPHGGVWNNSMLEGLDNGEYMYFVHSCYVKPDNSSATLSLSCYGNVEFCSSLEYQNIFASQYHPERSGKAGLKIYGNLAKIINDNSVKD